MKKKGAKKAISLYYFNLICGLLSSILLLTASNAVFAVDSIQLQGMFTNKAVLLIDEKRQILNVGKTSPEGIKLISTNSEGAILEINGKQIAYKLGQNQIISTTFTKLKTNKETIYANKGGMYMTHGSINGRGARFLVDTGASAVVMNINQARRFGIYVNKKGRSLRVMTASGIVKAYAVKLKSVKVGNIKEKNVQANVIDGNHPGPILLGMTFLGRLSVKHNANALTLIQK